MRKLVRRDEAQAPEGGFTLVEMVISIAVLAMVVLAVSGVFHSGLRALAAAKARARANEIATQGIEDLQRYSFNNLGLCSAPPGTPPTGLETNVDLSCGASPTFQNPCNTATVGTNPAAQYDCKDNNVTYTVKRYVAWVDAIKTTKRLAVFVEWTDLAGNHQVSQQSSLRAPDQAAITGLAPPTFSDPPGVSSAQIVTEGPNQLAVVYVDETGRLTSGSWFSLAANTSSLHKGVTTQLQSVIPAHQPNDFLNINVAPGAAFPSYNGFAVTIDTEVFRVTAGAGTTSWTVLAEGSATHSINAPVTFAGDQIYATVQTLAGNGSPQSSTVSLGSLSLPSQSWTATVNTNTGTGGVPFRFGIGKQYVSFGILRAADGKSTAAFAPVLLRVCPVAGCPASGSSTTEPLFLNATASGTTTVGSSGALTGDITVTAHTKNVTSSDSVTVGFLTQAGSRSMALSLKANTSCDDSATATAGEECQWVGVIAKADGHRFNTGPMTFYISAQQVDDNLNPGSIDNGETAVALPSPSITFSAAS